MKKVNFNSELEAKKVKIMADFNQNDVVQAADQSATSGAGSEPPVALPVTPPLNADELKEKVIDALKTVYDPEIPVNIFDLGLIYDVRIDKGFVDIDMTLTAPGCPVAHTFPGMVERSVCLVPGVDGAAVDIVWDPPWTPELISEAARLELGLI